VEFSQAVFLMVFPFCILVLLTAWTARKIHRNSERGQALIRRLNRHRQFTQLLGVASIFITAMYGMYQNLYVGPFGF
jgi:predicted MFS family arabinose efflux permease